MGQYIPLFKTFKYNISKIQYLNTYNTFKTFKKVLMSVHLLTSDTIYGENLCRTLTRRNRPTIKIISEIEKFSVDCDDDTCNTLVDPAGKFSMLHPCMHF